MKIVLTIVGILIPVMMIYSQVLVGAGSIKKKIPRGYASGYLILNDSSRLEGWIRNNIRHWSRVCLIEESGRKTTWTASQLREAVIEGKQFLCIDNDWLYVVESGPKLNLLQMAGAEQDGILYNGTEPVGIGQRTGVYGDYFLQMAERPDSLILISKRNVLLIVKEVMSGCEAIMAAIKERELELKEIPAFVRVFNKCEVRK